jgi:glycosyltransferase involved in cell wall biosynthesis
VKIAIVTTSFPRDAGDPSGHFVRAEARALASAGHEVHVVAPGGTLLQAPRRDGRITVHPAGGGALFTWPGAAARAREAPWRLLAAGPFALGVRARLRGLLPFDQAIAHWIVPSAFPLLLDATTQLEVVAHGADVRLLGALPRVACARIVSVLLDGGARFRFAASASLLTLASALPRPLADRLRAASRISPCAIEVPDVSARARALRASLAHTLVVVAAGRLVPQKRMDLAITAAARAGAKLVLVGDGPERARLTALASASGATVHFTGLLPRDEALAWIAAADVLVHPSAVEAAPTVVREARALGLPVVACAAGDVAAWAAQDEGIHLVPPEAEHLAQAVARAAGSGGPVHATSARASVCDESVQGGACNPRQFG